MRDKLHKRVSVGLNLNESVSDLVSFFDNYHHYLSSVYFSLPLGVKYYSRNELSQEYDNEESERKLLYIISLLSQYDIRSEVALNNYGLSNEDIYIAVEYMHKHNIYPDEIVCLREYFSILREEFPKSEIKYSFNNYGTLYEGFDTVVVGKGYLRDIQGRHNIIDSGKGLVILLNNGCSFDCRSKCGDSKYCSAILERNLKAHDINYLYALQSFFPSELTWLFENDSYASFYRFKISNRPLGLLYTTRCLESYCGLIADEETLISESTMNYALYCVMGSLISRMNQFSYDRIMEYKKQLMHCTSL